MVFHINYCNLRALFVALLAIAFCQYTLHSMNCLYRVFLSMSLIFIHVITNTDEFVIFFRRRQLHCGKD